MPLIIHARCFSKEGRARLCTDWWKEGSFPSLLKSKQTTSSCNALSSFALEHLSAYLQLFGNLQVLFKYAQCLFSFLCEWYLCIILWSCFKCSCWCITHLGVFAFVIFIINIAYCFFLFVCLCGYVWFSIDNEALVREFKYELVLLLLSLHGRFQRQMHH